MTPGGRDNFDPSTIIWTTLVEDLKIILYTKYLSSKPCTFNQEIFLKFLQYTYKENLWPPGAGPILTPGL
jgi:hypothetical protein